MTPNESNCPDESINELPRSLDRAQGLADYIAESSPDPGDRSSKPTVMVLAFEGWNDAGGAASAAVRTYAQALNAELVTKIEDETFYDFQFSRPKLVQSNGLREIIWPSTTILYAEPEPAPFNILFVHGVEPSFKWQAFTAELLTLAAEHRVSALLLVGSLLADVPHTRPIPSSLSADNIEVQERLDVSEPTYEGPVGIVGVLAHTAHQAGLVSLSLWAAVPHYVGQAPSPKAQLSLIRNLEDLLGVPVDPLSAQDIAEDADAWERGVNDLAEEDEDIAEYVKQLEESADTSTLPETSGEAIAEEFERYLRRRNRPPER